MTALSIAVYPGSFDPITNGHLSVIKRAVKIFGSISIAVARNEKKQYLFSDDERLMMVQESVQCYKNVSVELFDGLLVDYCVAHGASVMIRGLRAVSDFDQEFQLTLVNRRLNRDIETVFFMTDYQYSYLSSSLIRNLAALGGDISGLVPPWVRTKMMEKY